MLKQILILTMSFLILSLNPAIAQRKGKAPIGHDRLEQLKADLELTDEQVAELKQGMEELREVSKKMDRSEMDREKMKALREESNKKREALFESVLNTEQLEKMKQLHEKRKEEKSAKIKEMKQEKKRFMQETVKPYLTEQRANLDSKMSKSDVKKVNSIREIAKEMKQSFKEERKAEKGELDKSKGDRKGKHFHRHGKGHHGAKTKFIENFMKEKPGEFEALQSIATKYANQIDAIMEEMKAQKKVWKEERKAERKEDMKGKGKPKHGKKGHGKKADKQERPLPEGFEGTSEDLKRIGFLLMPTEIEEKKRKGKKRQK